MTSIFSYINFANALQLEIAEDLDPDTEQHKTKFHKLVNSVYRAFPNKSPEVAFFANNVKELYTTWNNNKDWLQGQIKELIRPDEYPKFELLDDEYQARIGSLLFVLDATSHKFYGFTVKSIPHEERIILILSDTENITPEDIIGNE